MSSIANLTKANILLVDDTPNNLRLLSAMLSDQGYEVRRVVNGQMALKTAQANPPDLILLDIKMPDMNGYEVCQHLKAIEQTQAIPVIFISALDEVLDKVKAFAVGAADYITKPFSEEEVLARVENILTIRQLQQQLQQVSRKCQQLEADLTSREENYQALFHNQLVGIFQMQPDGLLLAVNQHLMQLLGHQTDTELIQKRYFSEYCSEFDAKQLFAELQVSCPIRDYSLELYRQDRSTFWGSVSIQLSLKINCYEGILLEKTGTHPCD
ncbi:MAG: response regulator [Pegethrix bostrychoides GSE-TBD4-15B]|jgi:CheY-like chemotaxis protein|uniref:histidine kinase n=1 Tax=Pegethrix bostrychoides GSE-TBD4-15B TaxID=2839662 RepID=A0A951P9C1_9CYAN|nr:response regulator [Pegethrix bostrychoides GSE-TBD4-15B]